jgi:hypothetical protein
MKFAAAVAAVILSASEWSCGGSAAENPQVPTTASDRITLPDPRRESVAPSGKWAFVVSTPDAWAKKRGTGALVSVSGSTRAAVWSRELPQEYGPRFILVDDAGTVVLLDEWINVNSRYAVVVIDRDNRQIAQHSTDDVQAALGVPMSQIVQMAKHGWWITTPPVMAAGATEVHVETGGKVLHIRLSDGRLTSS